MADIITSQNPVYEGIPRKWVEVVDGDDTYYKEVVAVEGGGGSVTTDNTLTGDGTVGDPLSQTGGVGGPVRYHFSVRSVVSGSTIYAPIAQGGAIGSGGFDTSDPTDRANFNMNFATKFPAGTFTELYIESTAGPGDGAGPQSKTYSLQIDAAAPVGGPSVTFSGTPSDQVVSGSDTVNTATCADGALVALKITQANGPTLGACMGYLLFQPAP